MYWYILSQTYDHLAQHQYVVTKVTLVANLKCPDELLPTVTHVSSIKQVYSATNVRTIAHLLRVKSCLDT